MGTRTDRRVDGPRSNNATNPSKTGMAGAKLNSDPAWQRIRGLHEQRFGSYSTQGM